MLEAARAVRQFVEGQSRDTFLGDRMRQMAVERAIEIIGEAARRVSDELKLKHPEIPWRRIIGQRNVLAHDYGEIDQARIWALADRDIIDLVRKLERLA